MHWLDRYGADYHKWHLLRNAPSETWYRRVGIVEGMFDTDGTDFQGRADINTLLEAELSANVGTYPLRRKILLAWTVLRFQHLLLSARALNRTDFLSDDAGPPDERFFLVRKPGEVDEMVDEASRTVDFVADHYAQVDVEDFYTHVMNTARVFDSSEKLARLFILPLEPLPEGRFRFRAVSTVAHEIADALSIYRWHSHFLDLLNMPSDALDAEASRLCSPTADLQSRLPHAQEDLYPPVPGNQARQRWFWAISRILRDTYRPPPPSFPNPLRRSRPLQAAEPMPSTYAAILDYSRTPPLNTYSATATLSPGATSRMRSLCHQAGVSIGSGTFALVALVMMILYERQQQAPHTSHAKPPPLPFVATFPLNPRPFLTHPTPLTGPESSLILSFSDGLTLPFLPSHLPLEGRFRLLARQAHRQLRVYQKRKRSVQQEAELGSRAARQMLPQLYLFTLDIEEKKKRGKKRKQEQELLHLQPEGGSRSGNGNGNGNGVHVQGDYQVVETAATSILSTTCGVSSIGDRAVLIAPSARRRDKHRHTHSDDNSNRSNTRSAQGEGEKRGNEYDDNDGGTEAAAVFDFVDIHCTVRARDGEFLVGSAGDAEGIGFNVSFDGCAIDAPRVRSEWRGLMEGLFEEEKDEVEGRDGNERDTVALGSERAKL